MSQRYVIAVSGVAGAGKSALVNELGRALKDAVALSVDAYRQHATVPAGYRSSATPEARIEQWLTRGGLADEWELNPTLADVLRKLRAGSPVTLTGEAEPVAETTRYVIVEETWAVRSELRPLVDLLVFVDTPADVALARRVLRDADADPRELMRQHLAYGDRVARRVAAVVAKQADIVLDGTRPVEELAARVAETVRQRFEPPLTFKRATQSDLDTVYAIMQEAARWLASRGIMQWEWFLSDTGRRFVGKRLDNAEVYLACMGNEPVGTVTVQWEDREVWGELGQDYRAGYVHGLAVRRTVAGRGVGEQMIAFAEGRIRDQGRRFVRLDCMAENVGLCGYYGRMGFADQGVVEVLDGRWKARLFEREVAAELDSRAAA